MNEEQELTNENGVDLGGAETTGSHGIDWYRNDVDTNYGNTNANMNFALFDPEDSLLYNVIHEYGHVFDNARACTAASTPTSRSARASSPADRVRRS